MYKALFSYANSVNIITVRSWSLSIYCLYKEWFVLVFCRKDLCDARVKPKMSSYFLMKCKCSWGLPPIFRWHVQRRMSSYFQMKCSCSSSLPPSSDIWWPRAGSSSDDVYRGKWAHIFRWNVHAAQVYPPVVTSDGQEQGHLQMMCTEEYELIFSDEMFMQLKFTPQ